MTQAVIGERVGWEEGQVKKYSMVLNRTVPQVLDSAQAHQNGRGTDKVPNGTFDFTEGWFRNSGARSLKNLESLANLVPGNFSCNSSIFAVSATKKSVIKNMTIGIFYL